ncbi:MAG: hypothetical protein RI897_2808 [Verrucomicrobiota bacterium]
MGDIDGCDRVTASGPDHGEGEAVLFPGRGVDGVAWDVGLGLGCIAGEPAVVEAFGVVFIGTGEVPGAVVVDFDPGMVAAHIGPEGCADGAGGDTDGAAGIDEDDGEAGAGGFAGGLGFLEGLVGAFTAGVVVDLDLVEEVLVEGLGRF